jgi:hypothetical protein
MKHNHPDAGGRGSKAQAKTALYARLSGPAWRFEMPKDGFVLPEAMIGPITGGKQTSFISLPFFNHVGHFFGRISA